jgi:hypothetical protein
MAAPAHARHPQTNRRRATTYDVVGTASILEEGDNSDEN